MAYLKKSKSKRTMYINGRKITLDQLEELTQNLIGALINDIYDTIITDGIDVAIPGVKKKQLSMINKMIEYYVEGEQYEKCAVLRDKIKL
tara:strand:- start:2163 stop:2432 length:270 start_codon:yes stop_codon:yes gene_type:complete